MSEQELDSIALRLRSRKDNPVVNSLKEDIRLREAPEEDEDDTSGEAMNDLPDPDIDTSETDADNEPFDPKKLLKSKVGHMKSDKLDDEEDDIDSEDDEEVDVDDEERELELDEEEKDTKNPLDNPYAVLYEIGQKVSLVYTDGSSTSVDAVIEGYDKEGFYRIRLDSGLTISGLTDICLSEYIQLNNQSACICGCRTFVEEDGIRVCDRCGRPLKEDLELLKTLDNMGIKNKKSVIRAEQHPVSTSTKPDIQESLKDRIRKAFKN